MISSQSFQSNSKVAVQEVGYAEESLHYEAHPEAYITAETTDDQDGGNYEQPAQTWGNDDSPQTWGTDNAQGAWNNNDAQTSHWDTVNSAAVAQESVPVTDSNDDSQTSNWDTVNTAAPTITQDSVPVTTQRYVQNKSVVEAQQQAAEAALSAVFPNGYKMLPTSGRGLRCGIYALQQSFKHQQPQLAIPTEEQLIHAARYGDTSAAMTQLQPGEPLDAWFHTDHLQGVLQDYGANVGINFKLAVVYDTGPIFQSAVKVAPDGPTYIIWVYHSPKGIGHYQGIKAVEH